MAVSYNPSTGTFSGSADTAAPPTKAASSTATKAAGAQVYYDPTTGSFSNTPPKAAAAPAAPAAPTTKDGVSIAGHAFNPLNPGGAEAAANITKGVKQGVGANFFPALGDTSGYNAISDAVTGKGQTMGTATPTVGGKKVSQPISTNTAFNFIPSIVPAAANVLTSPITRIGAQIKQTFGGSGTVDLKMAGLAPVQSYSKQVETDVNSGVPTWLAVMKQAPSVIFDTLFVTGEGARLLGGPKEVPLTTGGKPSAIPTDMVGESNKPVYMPIDKANPAGAVVHDAVSGSSNYNPENPTFLKITPAEQGFKGQIVQLKPSLLNTDVTKLFGESGRPETSIPPRAETVVDKGGTIPKQELMQLHSGGQASVPAQGEPFSGAISATAPTIRQQFGVPPTAGAQSPTIQPTAGTPLPGSSAAIRQALAPKAAAAPVTSSGTQSVTPQTPVSQGSPAPAAQPLPKELQPLANNAVKLTQPEFVKQFEAALTSQNSTLKQTAQLHLTAIQNAGFKNISDFYNKANQVSSGGGSTAITPKQAPTVTIRQQLQAQTPAETQKSQDGQAVTEVAKASYGKPLLSKTSIATLLRNVPEFKSSPALTVVEHNGGTALEFAGKQTKFLIKPSALGLVEANLKPGQKIDVKTDDFLKSNKERTNVRVVEQKGSESVTLAAELVPGLSKFIEEDVKPKATGVAAGIKETYQGMVKIFNPGSLVPMKAMDILSTKIGEYEQQLFRTERSMKKIWKMWEKQPEAAKLSFMAAMEAGNFDVIPKEYQPLAKMYKERFDTMYKLVGQYKDINYLENWFPHIWKKEGQVSMWLGKRPLAGNQNFLHQRIFKTIEEGVKAGFKLVSTNPEQLTQIAEAGVARFVMANKIRIEEKKAGFFKYVKFNKPVPDGFAKINDKIAEVYLPKDPDAIGAAAKIGNYYAQEDLARVINNYLSKDVLRETAIGRGLLNVKNTMNAFQLGVSAFHVTGEALLSMMTSQDIAMSRLVRGDILGAAKDLILSPIAVGMYFNDGRKFYNGSPELMKIEHDIFAGGAKLRTNREYQGSALENFVRNVKTGNIPGALMRAPMAAIEASMRPIFSYGIPRIKVGAFRALFAEELKRNSEKIQSGEISREKVARDVWANIENRMGLLNYDRLFWNQTFKTAMVMTTRSVGWNYGSGAELGGAIADVFGGFGKTTGNVINLRKGPDGQYQFKNEFEFTPKIRFALSLVFSTMMLGAAYMLLHTGKKPKTLVDWFYPLDEKGRRKQFPTYMKDVYGAITDPKQTIENKAAPELTTLVELMQNRNYYKDMIWNPDDPVPEKLKQMTSFVLNNSFTPFSITNQQQLSAKGGITTGEKVESYLGITNAPSVLNKTQAQLDLQKKERQIYGAFAPRTPEQVQIDTLKQQAKAEIPQGNLTTFNQLKKMGAFKSAKEAAYFLFDAKQAPAQKAAGIQKSVDKILKFQGK